MSYNQNNTQIITDNYILQNLTVTEKAINLGSNTNIDLSLGNMFYRTIGAPITFTVSNVPVTGNLCSFILEITNSSSFNVNYWSGVKWTGNSAPTISAYSTDVLAFYTYDGGTNWKGMTLAKGIF